MSRSTNKYNIPDEAIYYVVTNYLTKKSVDSVSLTVGIPSGTVEDILDLFVQWAEYKGQLKDGVLNLDLGDE